MFSVLHSTTKMGASDLTFSRICQIPAAKLCHSLVVQSVKTLFLSSPVMRVDTDNTPYIVCPIDSWTNAAPNECICCDRRSYISSRVLNRAKHRGEYAATKWENNRIPTQQRYGCNVSPSLTLHIKTTINQQPPPALYHRMENSKNGNYPSKSGQYLPLNIPCFFISLNIPSVGTL